MEVQYHGGSFLLINFLSYTEPKGGKKEVTYYLGLITNYMTGVKGLILLLLIWLYKLYNHAWLSDGHYRPLHLP